MDRDLSVLDPSGGAGVLALHPGSAHTLCEVPGFVDHQHRVAVTEACGDVVAQVSAHAVGVPHRPLEQVLHAVRIPVAGVLGDAPAVLAREVSQQAEHEPTRPAAGLDPGEPAAVPSSSLSASPRQRAGPIPCHTVTARSSDVATTDDDPRWRPYVRDRQAGRSETTAGSLGRL